MTRNGGSCPYNLAPGHFTAPYEPVIPITYFEAGFTLKVPHMRGGTRSLEDVLYGAGFLPCPTTIRRECVIPPFLGSDVSAVHPFHPKRVFFGGYGPNKLGDGGLIPGSVVLNPRSAINLGFARICMCVCVCVCVCL